MIDFVHLHVHSDYSLLDAAVSVMALADKAEKMGMTHLALTDHGNLFGAMDFIDACNETINDMGQPVRRVNPIKPIIGCEVYVAPRSRFEKKTEKKERDYFHFVLLASNRIGYQNLIKLCSLAYIEGFYKKPRIDDELLAQHKEGLIALSACANGEIPRLIQAGDEARALERAVFYRDLFGRDEKGNPNFYLEIQDHGIPAEHFDENLSQKDINKIIAGLSQKTGIPLVATNDVHYLNRDDSIAHDILKCIGTGTVRSEENRVKFYGEEFYLKTGDEMAAVFPEYPEAISNTVKIAERCITDVPMVNITELPNYLPDFEIEKGFENADSYLRHLVKEGLSLRYPGSEKSEEIKQRTEYELDVIIRMGFTGYFLIVTDFINWARANDISVGPGRGSGAGSIVAYALRITDIDPLKYNLLFERFLNPERISMPDFDVDFANEGRDSVINYVTEKYGRERVGQIITFGTLGAKAVIKDVARVLGISIPESEMITKLIPKDPKITITKAIEGDQKLAELREDNRYHELFTLAIKLEGLNRHSSLHASGVVIGKTPLIELVPLYKDQKTGAITTQFDMTHLEKCGLAKMDFLGLKTLDVIKHSQELIRNRGGEYADFDIDKVPEDDKATFTMLGEGLSFEVFQFEKEGMQDTLKRAKPGKIEDLIALNALNRPGPMANIPQFINSKNGVKAIVYPDPSLEEVLKETYGVIVYQEQVMHVARIIAGYNLGQADLVRKAMGKKIPEILDNEKKPFIEGAVKQGFSARKAEDIFNMLVPFANYGFNKSHSTGYAVLAYRTAYLKANFPEEYMAACLTNEINSTDKDKLSACIAEARKLGLVVDPPDINLSGKHFAVADGRIVYGLLGIKGLGEGPTEEIVNCRKEGPFKDFMDFLNRIDIKAVGKSVIEKLILTGAFDNLNMKRETLRGNLERAVEYAQKIKDDKKFGQGNLFGEGGESEFLEFEFNEYPEQQRAEKLKTEKELIGFYFSGHPMDEYKEMWEKLVKLNLGSREALEAGLSGSSFLIGLIKNLKPIITGRGDKMAFATLEDFTGEIELTFFSSVWEKFSEKIENDKVVILKGKLEFQQIKDKFSFTVDEYLEADNAENIVIEEEKQARRWDKYKNILENSKELGLNFPDLGFPGNIKDGNYTVIGLIKNIRTHIDKKGKEMAFGSLKDPRGEIDLVFFARTWENCKELVIPEEILAIKGTIEKAKDKKSGNPSLIVSSLHDMNKLIRAAAKAAKQKPIEKVSEVNKNIAKEVHIRLCPWALNNKASLSSLKECLEEIPGSCPVFIHIPISSSIGEGQKEKVVRTVSKINADTQGSLGVLARCKAVADIWSAN